MLVTPQGGSLHYCAFKHSEWAKKVMNGIFSFLDNLLMALRAVYSRLDCNDRHASASASSPLRRSNRAEPRTSSTQKQVWAGLGAGSGLGGLGLKLSLEPRVEQWHAQEIEPGRQRHKAGRLKPTWCFKSTQRGRFIPFPSLEKSLTHPSETLRYDVRPSEQKQTHRTSCQASLRTVHVLVVYRRLA